MTMVIIITPLGHSHGHNYYYHSAWPWPWSLLSLRLAMAMVIIITPLGHGHRYRYGYRRRHGHNHPIVIIITPLDHGYRYFLSYSPLIWKIIYTMGYPCIYQKYPRPFHNTSTSPRPSHKNQMIWSQYHTLPWYDIDTPYTRPSQTFPRRN